MAQAHVNDIQSVGVIGLGGMGTALVRSLLGVGHAVSVHDSRHEAMEPLVADGATPLKSPAELAAACDIVVTFLPGPAEVEHVLLESHDSVLSGVRPGARVLDMSTCGPDTAVRVGAAFDGASAVFVDCPVSRKAPDMTVLVGGEQGVLGPAESVLTSVSRTLIHCGRRGGGYATKLLNQHVKYSWYLASSEALLIAREWGLDASAAADAIEQCSGGESGLATAAEFFRNDTAKMASHAPARTIEKDMRLAKELADASAVASPTLDVVADFFADVATTDYLVRPYPESTELLAQLRRLPPQNRG